jgi:hypothetical protein
MKSKLLHENKLTANQVLLIINHMNRVVLGSDWFVQQRGESNTKKAKGEVKIVDGTDTNSIASRNRIFSDTLMFLLQKLQERIGSSDHCSDICECVVGWTVACALQPNADASTFLGTSISVLLKELTRCMKLAIEVNLNPEQRQAIFLNLVSSAAQLLYLDTYPHCTANNRGMLSMIQYTADRSAKYKDAFMTGCYLKSIIDMMKICTNDLWASKLDHVAITSSNLNRQILRHSGRILLRLLKGSNQCISQEIRYDMLQDGEFGIMDDKNKLFHMWTKLSPDNDNDEHDNQPLTKLISLLITVINVFSNKLECDSSDTFVELELFYSLLSGILQSTRKFRDQFRNLIIQHSSDTDNHVHFLFTNVTKHLRAYYIAHPDLGASICHILNLLLAVNALLPHLLTTSSEISDLLLEILRYCQPEDRYDEAFVLIPPVTAALGSLFAYFEDCNDFVDRELESTDQENNSTTLAVESSEASRKLLESISVQYQLLIELLHTYVESNDMSMAIIKLLTVYTGHLVCFDVDGNVTWRKLTKLQTITDQVMKWVLNETTCNAVSDLDLIISAFQLRTDGGCALPIRVFYGLLLSLTTTNNSSTSKGVSAVPQLAARIETLFPIVEEGLQQCGICISEFMEIVERQQVLSSSQNKNAVKVTCQLICKIVPTKDFMPQETAKALVTHAQAWPSLLLRMLMRYIGYKEYRVPILKAIRWLTQLHSQDILELFVQEAMLLNVFWEFVEEYFDHTEDSELMCLILIDMVSYSLDIQKPPSNELRNISHDFFTMTTCSGEYWHTVFFHVFDNCFTMDLELTRTRMTNVFTHMFAPRFLIMESPIYFSGNTAVSPDIHNWVLQDGCNLEIDIENINSKIPDFLLCYAESSDTVGVLTIPYATQVIQMLYALCSVSVVKKKHPDYRGVTWIQEPNEVHHILRRIRTEVLDADLNLDHGNDKEELQSWVNKLQSLMNRHSKRGFYELITDLEDVHQDIPNVFICPITLKIMEDPVILADGSSYEREAIVRWVATNNRSPKTNEVLSTRSFFPNNSLKAMIQEYMEKRHRKYLQCPDNHPSKRARPNPEE